MACAMSWQSLAALWSLSCSLSTSHADLPTRLDGVSLIDPRKPADEAFEFFEPTDVFFQGLATRAGRLAEIASAAATSTV